ncbi:MAG: acyl-CoA carboxylase subunit epsilon [Actinobacteria bacterium]|nr:acyl-CoA carboxylase subunit epsilon [Actinomycetota bacterium]MBW3646638.1 acyl-CoA carboxylase subunit epsilon [Actinomycetota bacterium]
MTGPDDGPLFTVARGVPTVQELAALVALLRPPSHDPPAPAEPVVAVGFWAARSAGLRRPLPAGPGAWRGSALPR